MSSGITTYIEIYALTFLLYDWGNPHHLCIPHFSHQCKRNRHLSLIGLLYITALFNMCYTVSWVPYISHDKSSTYNRLIRRSVTQLKLLYHLQFSQQSRTTMNNME